MKPNPTRTSICRPRTSGLRARGAKRVSLVGMVLTAALVLASSIGGLAGVAAAATPAPRVTGISPASGASGTVVTITGTNLTGATAVSFGPGNNATTFSVTNATTVTATAPAGSGTVDVQVTTPGGTSQVQTLDWFTYTASLTLNPTQVIVPADGSIEGAVTATLTSGGSPAAAGITVTATETTPSLGTKSLASCTTGSVGAGQCLIETEPDAKAETGTVTVTASGFATGTAKVVYSAPGTAPTGLTMALANGNGTAAAVNGTDTFSDGNHYFTEETSGLAAQYENTASQAVVSATMVNGSTPLSSGTEPYALNWSLHNTGVNSLYIDAIANTSEMPYTNVICTLATQTDPNGSLACTPSSYDLDYNPHFSNPANPGAIGLGVTNNTMTASTTSGVRVVAAGATITFTTYMVGQANNAMVVLDSPTGLPTSATISAQLALDPAFTAVAGTAFGNTVTSNLKWLAPATGTSVSGTVVATDPAATTTAGSNHNWAVLNVGTTPTLVNFGQSATQTYSANTTSVTEATFESDLAAASSASLAVTNYGATNQANALTGTFTAPTVTGVSPNSGSTAGGTSVTITGTNLTGATGVTFGSTAATGVVVNSATSVTAVSPAESASTVDVRVTGPGGTSAVNAPSDQFTFSGTVSAAPTVTGVSPNSGPSAGGTSVTISGTNLAGATAVKFGKTNATSFTLNSPPYVSDSFSRTVASGWGTADTGGAWTLQKGGGTTGSESVNGTSGVLNSVCSFYTQDEQVLTTSASALNFNFAFDVYWPQDEKTLSSPTADYGGMVAGVVARYQNASDVDSSYYKMNASWDANGGTPVLMLRAQSNGTTPAGGAFRLNVSTGIDPTVDYPSGGPYGYHVKGEITGTNPTTFLMKIWKVGTTEPSTWQLSGSDTANAGPQVAGLVGFRNSCDLSNDGGSTFLPVSGTQDIQNLSVTPTTPTTITAVAPPGTGTNDITVTTPGGTSAITAADQYTYTTPPTPTVTGISPTSGTTAGGTSVTITGTNLTGATGVKFGTTAATGVVVNSATQVTATSPAGSGTVDVTVTTPGGTSATSPADQYTYTTPPTPTVTGISPTSGTTAGGTSVTITGTNLTGATGVKFGTTAATGVVVNSATQVTATSPAGSGTVDVTVTTPGGTSATSPADQYTYTTPPTPTVTGSARPRAPRRGGPRSPSPAPTSPAPPGSSSAPPRPPAWS